MIVPFFELWFAAHAFANLLSHQPCIQWKVEIQRAFKLRQEEELAFAHWFFGSPSNDLCHLPVSFVLLKESENPCDIVSMRYSLHRLFICGTSFVLNPNSQQNPCDIVYIGCSAYVLSLIQSLQSICISAHSALEVQYLHMDSCLTHLKAWNDAIMFGR